MARIENATDIHPTILAFSRLVVDLPNVSAVRLNAQDMEVLVEDEPIFVEFNQDGFRRIDFTLNVPLGPTPEQAVESFAQMLVIPMEELQEAYGA